MAQGMCGFGVGVAGVLVILPLASCDCKARAGFMLLRSSMCQFVVLMLSKCLRGKLKAASGGERTSSSKRLFRGLRLKESS